MMMQTMPVPTSTMSSSTKQDFTRSALLKRTSPAGSFSLPSKSDVDKVAGGVQRTSSGSLVFMLAGLDSKLVPTVPITTTPITSTTAITTNTGNKTHAARHVIDLCDELLGDDSMSSLIEDIAAESQVTATVDVEQAASEEFVADSQKPYSELETVEMLQGICVAHKTTKQKTEVLDKCIVAQMELATARHQTGSTCGVAVAMSKVGRINEEKERVHSALATLEHHAETIQSKLNDARQEATSGFEWGSTSTDLELDLSAHECYRAEMDTILAGTAVAGV